MSIRNEILRLFEQSLSSHIKDRKSREALLFRASLDQALEAGIELEGNASQFCPLFVKALSEYGKMSDGRYALNAVLEAAKSGVGPKAQAECDTLLSTLREFWSTPGYTLFQPKQGQHPENAKSIFLSYVCEGDDQSLPRPQLEWIERFIRDLSTQLSLDVQQRLAGQRVDDSEMVTAFEQASLILLLLSQESLHSTWWQTFSRRFEGNQSPVFILEKERIVSDRRAIPREKAQGYYRFWGTEGQQSFQPDDLSYATVFSDMKKKIQTLSEASEERLNGMITVSAAPRATVFLAEVTDDLYHLREDVKRYLAQAQIHVLPEAYYPLEPKAFKEAVRQDLAQSQLFVQLLSTIPFKKMPDLPQGRVRCQYELALETKTRVLQWRASELVLAEIHDPEQREFLQQEGVLAVGIEEFKSAIVKNALPPKKPAQQSLPFLLVKWENSDTELMDELFEELRKFPEIRFACPPHSDKRSRFEKRLLQSSDGFMILYGSVSPQWVHEQYEDVLDMRERPFEVQGIYDGPPEEKANLPFHDPRLHVLNCRECCKEEDLRRFIELLQQGGLS